jgi:hypothetical protein
MYNEFSIVAIDTAIQNKQIIIEANKTINSNASDNIVIELYERATKTPLVFNYTVEKEKLIITSRDWPIPNTDYILGVTGITSVTGDTLEGNIKKRVKFESNVLSTVKVTSPIMFEEVKSLDINLVEEADDSANLVGSYYIEVATDNAFFNIVHQTTASKASFTLYLKEQGQHFIRARVQKDDCNYSRWSPAISFIYGAVPESYPTDLEEEEALNDIPIEIDDDLEPIIDLSVAFEIIELPEQGVTPEEALLIAFSNVIDDLSIDNIVITRKDVR